MENEQQRYQNQAAWDNEMGRLVMSMQKFGDFLTPKQSRALRERLEEVVPRLAAEYGSIPSGPKSEFLELMQSIIPNLPEDRLMNSQDIESHLNYVYSSPIVARKLVHSCQQLGLAQVNLSSSYWFKMGNKKGAQPSNKKQDYPLWKFISHCLNQRGYCESPALLNSGSKPNTLDDMNSVTRAVLYRHLHLTAFRYSCLSREPAETHRLRDLALNGRRAFAKFVKQTGLPTASLGNIKQAIVYNPEKMRKIYGLA